MLIKVNTLADLALNWAVAKALGEYEHNLEPKQFTKLHDAGEFHYSTDLFQGGSIIEWERINPTPYTVGKDWFATLPNATGGVCVTGPTLLIAAMRCFVTSKLGEEIEIPDELLS